MQPTVSYDTLIAAHPGRDKRVLCLDMGTQKLWVKRATKNHINFAQFLYAGLRATFSRLIGRPIASSALERMREEKSCIEALRRRGIIVPEIVYEGMDYMVLSDIGPSIQSMMQQTQSASEYERLSRLATAALDDLHRKGGWHGSNSSLRDMTISEQGVGFIDFEHSSNPLFPTLLQARDLWMLGQAIAKFDRSGRLTANMLSHYHVSTPKRIIIGFAFATLPFYLLLRPFGKSLGPEVSQATACTQGVIRYCGRGFWRQ